MLFRSQEQAEEIQQLKKMLQEQQAKTMNIEKHEKKQNTIITDTDDIKELEKELEAKTTIKQKATKKRNNKTTVIEANQICSDTNEDEINNATDEFLSAFTSKPKPSLTVQF